MAVRPADPRRAGMHGLELLERLVVAARRPRRPTPAGSGSSRSRVRWRRSGAAARRPLRKRPARYRMNPTLALTMTASGSMSRARWICASASSKRPSSGQRHGVPVLAFWSLGLSSIARCSSAHAFLAFPFIDEQHLAERGVRLRQACRRAPAPFRPRRAPWASPRADGNSATPRRAGRHGSRPWPGRRSASAYVGSMAMARSKHCHGLHQRVARALVP